MPDDPIFYLLSQRVLGVEPDDFQLQCRRALVNLVSKMPADQAKIIYDQVSTQCPYATAEEHRDWIESVHYKALQLEVMHKLNQI